MALSDPTYGVPTPTGVLQGVAAFNYDGSAWQPSGRAGPCVATPTGVLKGVAAFNDGAPWQPAGFAGPGVATPTGVLEGVAVYTWSGSQWTPPGGGPSSSTPTGALRGVAAVDWDGSQWQPAGQAGPDVATPFGVLQGVARFNWTGSAWAAVGAPSLSLDFMTPGTLDPRITFTRASTATYTDASGTIQTAAVNAPRWDYAGGSLRGLLLEDTSTNLALQSGNLANVTWSGNGITSAAPIVTANQTTAPDGTLTAACLVFPSVSAPGAASGVYQGITLTANSYAFSVWLKGSVGGEQLYIGTLGGIFASAPRITLTTQWQRFTHITGTFSAGISYFQVGTDLRDGTQTSTPGGTVYAWGAQVELNYASSYIPTVAATVTRAADALRYPVASISGFTQTQGTLLHEYILEGAVIGFGAPAQFVKLGAEGSDYGSVDELTMPSGSTTTNPTLGQATVAVGGTSASANYTTVQHILVGLVQKGAAAWSVGTVIRAAHNGVASDSNSGALTLTPAFTDLTLSGPMHFQNPVSQWARHTQYWPYQLSQPELGGVTT